VSSQDEVFFFLSPELENYLSENDIGARELFQKAGFETAVRLGEDPAARSTGKKEPATILLASAAVIAAATPIVRELIRNISGREAVVRERRLLPVEDSKGNEVRNTAGEPILHWVDVSKGHAPDQAPQSIKIKGFGIEISFGGK
jgi:hypothetical protein